jgi:hypothetical protein
MIDRYQNRPRQINFPIDEDADVWPQDDTGFVLITPAIANLIYRDQEEDLDGFGEA